MVVFNRLNNGPYSSETFYSGKEGDFALAIFNALSYYPSCQLLNSLSLFLLEFKDLSYCALF